MATITHDNVVLTVWNTQAPGATDNTQSVVQLTQPTATAAAGEAGLIAPWIHAQVTAFLYGAPAEDVSGWQFGFIQLKFVTTDWASFRGAHDADGSVFIAADRPPVRPQQLCRDTYLPEESPYTNGVPVWYDPDRSGLPTAGGRFARVLSPGTTIPHDGKLMVVVDFSDSPSRHWPLVEQNTLFNPSRENYLHECMTEAAFVTIFAAREQRAGQTPGPYHFLRHFYWNVTWQATLQRSAAGVFSVVSTNDMLMSIQSGTHTGIPNDHRFRHHVVDKSLPVCNTVVRAAMDNPAARHRDKRWKSWHVGH